MRSNNAISQNTVLSKLPDWLGGIINSTCGATRMKEQATVPVEQPAAAAVEAPELVAIECPATGEVESVVDEMLAQGRYALLLRPQLIKNLTHKQLSRTRTALSEGMCLVPEGQVVIRRNPAPSDDDKEAPPSEGPSLRVQAYYLDRYPVTNAQYYQFVASGGYEQLAIWDPEIWPALLDFVDATGHPGPRYWREGRFPRSDDNHPVIGVSWYEALAYSRWTGKRLPTDAEWVKAGSWPVSIQGHPLLLRRYPWGEAMDRGRANLWGSGPGRTVSVYEFPGGVSVGGVHGLIGNVWEWTADAFLPDAAEASGVSLQAKMKSIRGGAFDTYLDCQATCHFACADVALARKHNIGFRCAISLCDLAVKRDVSAEPSQEDEEQTETSFAENQT
ncbi:MAG: SUMF1/EgtB/PvdO family nonheme iron enzyme [Pirellulales bacterium]